MRRWKVCRCLRMLIVVLFCFLFVGCIAIPTFVEDSVHKLSTSNLIISEDYHKLITEKYAGEELENKKSLLAKHLDLLDKLEKYVTGRGGRISLPWAEVGKEAEDVE